MLVHPLSQPARAVWIEILSLRVICLAIIPSQPARAVWIEIWAKANTLSTVLSQPARAVWIEITCQSACMRFQGCHSLRGLCGLKYGSDRYCVLNDSHSLRGLCGLKYFSCCVQYGFN